MTWTWLKRRHKIGYRELWHLHYGGAHEGDKGCQREYDFLLEVTGGWKDAYESERSLRIEAENLLLEQGIEPPREERWRSIRSKWQNSTENGTVAP